MAANTTAPLTFRVIQFMNEASVKLLLKPVSLATAATLYHKFFQVCSDKDFDPHLIAATCLYLGAKVEEDNVKIRDVVNVCYRGLYPNEAALDMGPTYTSLKESVAQCELLLLRQIEFRVDFVHPHKYLLYYITSLDKWLTPDRFTAKAMVIRTAWAMLRDSYLSDLCLRYKAEHFAVSVLYFALQCYAVDVPGKDAADVPWWQSFVSDINIVHIRTVISDLIDLYEMENRRT